MTNELYIHIRPEAVKDPEELLANFPYESGQSIISATAGVIIITLGDSEDSTDTQDWYLNSHDDVVSFYVVED
jgi:hypothetical protein